MRINKYLARSGLGSRRYCEKLIKNNYVMINGEICKNLSYKVKENDVVQFNGKIIYPNNNKVYYIFNKPIGVITSMNDQYNRMDIKYYLNKHKIQDRVFPVGRLDYDSSGLLILTNDGDLANKLMHPRFNINKEYQVIINGILNDKAKVRLEYGIELEEGITSNSKITILEKLDNKTKLNIIIHQGWNRQIRRMFIKTGYEVISLKRTAIGNIKLSNLKPGNIRKISEKLIQNLKCLF